MSSIRITYRDPALGYPVGTFVDSYGVPACRRCYLRYAVPNDVSHHHPPRNLPQLPPLEIPVCKDVKKG